VLGQQRRRNFNRLGNDCRRCCGHHDCLNCRTTVILRRRRQVWKVRFQSQIPRITRDSPLDSGRNCGTKPPCQAGRGLRLLEPCYSGQADRGTGGLCEAAIPRRYSEITAVTVPPDAPPCAIPSPLLQTPCRPLNVCPFEKCLRAASSLWSARMAKKIRPHSEKLE